MAGFEAEMEAKSQRDRVTGQKFGGGRDLQRTYAALNAADTAFRGYETLEAESVVLGLLQDGAPVQEASEGTKEVEVVLAESPFYPEGGGQVGDTGVIEAPKGRLRVLDTQRPVAGLIAHRALVEEGRVAVGDPVRASVDVQRRTDIARNHTATHLLHAALRRVLGAHVRQAGSLVAPDRLRFDFAHVGPVTDQELQEVQRQVNGVARLDAPITVAETTYREAVDQGALAFFGEQYGERVRVVQVDGESPFSFEVCGGTHLERTGELGYVHVTGESGIGAGMRRIEAVTGRGAEVWLAERIGWLDAVAQRLNTAPGEAALRVEALLEEVERSRKVTATTRKDAILKEAEAKADAKVKVGGVGVIAVEVKAAGDLEALREMADYLRSKLGSGVVALGAVVGERLSMVTMVTPDLVAKGLSAAELAKAAGARMGGSGGGRAEVAQAGGKDVKMLNAALEAVVNMVREKVS